MLTESHIFEWANEVLRMTHNEKAAERNRLCSHRDLNPLPQGVLLKAPHCSKPLTRIGDSYRVYALAPWHINYFHCQVIVV